MIRPRLNFLKHLFYAASLLLCLSGIAEIGLRMYDSATGQVTRRDLYDRGLVCKSWFVHHTLKPAHTFSVRAPDAESRVRVQTNSLGLRGPEVALPKPVGTYRILCLGDDNVLGVHVAESDTWCRQLEKTLRSQSPVPVEVVNAGVPDYCPLLSCLQLRAQLLSLQPDLVIQHFDMSDVADDYLARRHTRMSPDGTPLACAHPRLELTRRGQSSAEPLFLLPEFFRTHIGPLCVSHMLAQQPRSIDSPTGRYAWLEDQPPEWSPYIQQAFSPLECSKRLLDGSPAGLIVVTSPAPWQVAAEASAGSGVREQAGVAPGAVYSSSRPFDLLAEYCGQIGVPMVNCAPAFRKDPAPAALFHTNAATLSAAGHALYAAQVAEFVSGMLPGARRSPGQSPESLPPAPTAGRFAIDASVRSVRRDLPTPPPR